MKTKIRIILQNLWFNEDTNLFFEPFQKYIRKDLERQHQKMGKYANEQMGKWANEKNT